MQCRTCLATLPVRALYFNSPFPIPHSPFPIGAQRHSSQFPIQKNMLPYFDNNKFPLYLAPMAGVTDPIFRSLSKELGADVMVTEFVSAEGVMQAWERNQRYVQFSDDHRPLGVQIFGSSPERMASAARVIWDAMQPDFIDINAGCPVPKVVGKNGGSSLLKDLPLLQDIARAVHQEMHKDCPVTAKIRIGWDFEHINALECVQRLEDAGMAAIAIHGRTRSQQYGGHADWDIIRQCAQSVPNTPIIGNGDISTPEQVKQIKEEGLISGVMIGRAAMASPWIFTQCKHYLETGEIAPPPTPQQKVELMLRHTRLALSSGHYGSELTTMRAMRSRLLSYGKGIPGCKPLRPQLARVASLEELQQILSQLPFN